MMKYLKYTIFALVVLSYPLQAVADIPNNVRLAQKRHITIIGHTGQDPVYRSTVGSGPFIEPELWFIGGTDSFDSVSIKSVSSLLIDSENWADEITSINALNLSNIPLSFEIGSTYWSNDDFVPLNTIPNDSTLPAPPAFLLVLSGIFGRTRRNK
jgi:hypothetical protein